MSAIPQASASFDEDGFLLNPEDWNRDIGSAIAMEDGFPQLSDAQWAIIDSLRQYYFRHHAVPAFAHICHTHHMGNHCVEELFDNSPRKAWRIAGLPNPGEEAKTYM